MNTMSEVAETRSSGRPGPANRDGSPGQDHPFRLSRPGDAAAGSDIDLLVLFSEVADPNQRAANFTRR